ncbi:hypothetical protein FNV43_RR16824 [Rhamnella rubrinervis]|uniref:Uncharacterized protein n=1 Tax=Rhamnella rubrinervis TaxID=2594499 RepID=A0A8K0GZH5_9ROSA|nr:hypothetical protein FNV43_RR16824 [Rhamnella rubrinervis]
MSSLRIINNKMHLIMKVLLLRMLVNKQDRHTKNIIGWIHMKICLMNEEGKICDEEKNVMQIDSEVQFISPSKVIQQEPRIKKRAEKLKLPFVVSTETRETLNNILPPSMDFDPKRPPPYDISMKCFERLTSDMDEVIDYNIYDVSKEFFCDLVQGEWLNDKGNIERRWPKFEKWRKDEKSRKTTYEFDMGFLSYISNIAYTPSS